MPKIKSAITDEEALELALETLTTKISVTLEEVATIFGVSYPLLLAKHNEQMAAKKAAETAAKEKEDSETKKSDAESSKK